MSEIELILVKLKIVSEEKENGAYICDKKHSKILLNYIKQKDKEIERLKEEYIMLQNASDEVEEEKDREIERQKEIIKQLDINNLELTTIIKEVREYIEVCSRVVNNNTDVVCDYESLMSILDKESK